MKLVFATNNNHKFQEIRSILPESYELLTLDQIGCSEDPPETHDTMEGNALEKARFVYDRYGYACFADDSGLEVEALNGRPGVFSARYAGDEKDMEKNMERLLSEMQGIKNRNARFRTVIAYIDQGKSVMFEGIVDGVLLETKAGEGGFGYDPVFRPDGFPCFICANEHASKKQNKSQGQGIRAVNKLFEFTLRLFL